MSETAGDIGKTGADKETRHWQDAIVDSKVKDDDKRKLVESPTLDVASRELRAFLIALISAIFEHQVEVPPEEQEGAPAAEQTSGPDAPEEKEKKPVYRAEFADEAVIGIATSEPDHLRKTASEYIGTHNGKAPIPTVKLGSLFADPVVGTAVRARGLPYLSSFAIDSIAPVSGSGNAALMKHMKLLTHSFLLDGNRVAVWSDIASDGPIRRELEELNFGKELLDDLARILRARSQGPDTHQVDPGLKYLYWPLDNDGYIVLSPLHPSGLADEINARTRFDPEATHWVPTTRVKVGGDKPQIVGMVANRWGGLRHLRADFPSAHTLSAVERALWKLRKTGSLLTGRGEQTELQEQADLVIQALNDPRQNQAARSRRSRALHNLAAGVLDPVVTVARWAMEAADERRETLLAIPVEADWERELLDPYDRGSDVDIEKAATAVAEVMAEIVQRDGEGFLVDDGIFAAMQQAASDVIKEI